MVAKVQTAVATASLKGSGTRMAGYPQDYLFVVNPGEPLLNVVIKNKPKRLTGLDQKGTGSGSGVPNSPDADDVPPAERRNLSPISQVLTRNVVSL